MTRAVRAQPLPFPEAFRAGLAGVSLIGFQRPVELPDDPLHAVFHALQDLRGDPDLVDVSFRMHPAQGMGVTDTELTGIVAEHRDGGNTAAVDDDRTTPLRLSA